MGGSFPSFGRFLFEFWVLTFRVLSASFSRFRCFVFESWVFRFRDLNALFSNYPYFCSIWLSLKSEIQWLNRLDFSFDHSVLSLLMVNSKGGSLRILILFSDMKSTSEVPVLRHSPFRFGKFAFLVDFDVLWRLFNLNDLEIEAVDGQILFAKTSWKINYSRPFQPWFQIFRQHVEVYPNKTN